MKVTNYTLLVDNGSDKLSDQVNDYLDKGYVLVGDVQLSQCYLNDKIRVLVAQAVALPV